MMTVQMEEDNHTVWNQFRAQFQTGQTKPDKCYLKYKEERQEQRSQCTSWFSCISQGLHCLLSISWQFLNTLPNANRFDRRASTSKILFFEISTSWAQCSHEGGGSGQDQRSYYLSCLSGTQLRASHPRVLLCEPREGTEVHNTAIEVLHAGWGAFKDTGKLLDLLQ